MSFKKLLGKFYKTLSWLSKKSYQLFGYRNMKVLELFFYLIGGCYVLISTVVYRKDALIWLFGTVVVLMNLYRIVKNFSKD